MYPWHHTGVIAPIRISKIGNLTSVVYIHVAFLTLWHHGVRLDFLC